MTQIIIIITVVVTLYSIGCFLHYKNLLFFPKNYLEEIGVVREDGYYEGFHTSNLKYLEELQEVRKELLEKKIDHKGRKLSVEKLDEIKEDYLKYLHIINTLEKNN